MNIFYLHEDPQEASEMMCDKHNVKMILESAQMLSTAHRVLDGDEYADQHELHKATHKNHPSTVWTRSTDENYDWHFDLFKSSEAEFIQYLIPVGSGPSPKICPKWAPHFLQLTSILTIA